MSEDGGITWSCVFLSKTEPDPEAVVVIQEGEVHEEEDNEEQDENIVIEIDEDQIVANPAADGSVRRNLFNTTEDMEDVAEKDSADDVQMEDVDAIEDDPEVEQDGIREEDETKVPPVVQELSVPSVLAEGEVLVDPVDKFSATVQSKKVSLSVMNEPIYEIENIEERKDSDHEDDDYKAETRQRLINKTKRHLRRSQLQVSDSVQKLFPVDKVVLEEFQDYMIMRTVSESNSKHGTVTKAVGHIIDYPDSLVQYKYFKDDSFRLKQNLDFSSKDYRDPDFPLDWINATCSDNPSRAVEKLKSHGYWRDFLKLKVSKSSVSTKRKTELNNVIDGITKDITDQRVYRRFQILLNDEAVEKKRAKQTLNPDEASTIVNAVKTWNESDVKKNLDIKMTNYYDDARVKGKDKLRNREFTQFSHYVRFTLILSDKNRISTYKFRNVDFASNNPVWFPDGCDLSNLPIGYNPHQPPSPDKPPSAWVMQVPGTTFHNIS